MHEESACVWLTCGIKGDVVTNGNKDIFKPDGIDTIRDWIERAFDGGKALLNPADTVFALLFP